MSHDEANLKLSASPGWEPDEAAANVFTDNRQLESLSDDINGSFTLVIHPVRRSGPPKAKDHHHNDVEENPQQVTHQQKYWSTVFASQVEPFQFVQDSMDIRQHPNIRQF
jgi:hypothetical protein